MPLSEVGCGKFMYSLPHNLISARPINPRQNGPLLATNGKEQQENKKFAEWKVR